MAKRLKDIAITHISLVKEGANGKSVIYKSKDALEDYFRSVKIAKSDTEKGIVYGIVYSPDEIDTQGDAASAAEIEKAAFAFMKGLNIKNVDRDHNFKPDGAYVCESWIVKSGDPLFPNEKEGSWAVGIKLETDELKEAVKKGDLKALSMAGTAIKEDSDEGLLKSILKGFETILKGFNAEKNTKEGEQLEREKEVAEVIKGLDSIKEALSELNALKQDVDELKNELKKSKQENATQENQNDIGGLL
ncbi:XkdF-like putative serine protease domain-containing protein [Campylobacter fetus]|uniref:XkdF-like putative serine protease domain-containing protein n=1 Tax=Campylobacter fetus TaxID=196 RepID=UPI00138E271F|nr:XkdF-like putative serine protease domain-containing protein [Campylobacter fetus]